MKALQKNLIEMRKERGWTSEDVCAKSGIAAGTYSNLENGKSDPRLSTINKLCILYDCVPNYLLCDRDNPESEVYPPYRHKKGGERTSVYG